jgi:coenzyme F420 hydrogenase subunit beta
MPSQQLKFDRIQKYNLCIGCGLCEAMGKEHGYTMDITSEGFYKPVCSGSRNAEFEKQVGEICPGINLNAPKSDNDIWGNITGLYNSWSTDVEVRRNGSSGGGISAICIYLIEEKIVDGILHVGKLSGKSIYNELSVSRSRTEIIQKASSKYAPAKIFNSLIDIFENTEGAFAFVGKPCDIAGLKNFLEINPQYKDRIKYRISFFCAGMPSYNATLKLFERAGQKELPYFLKYRGDGWPGYFTAKFDNGEVYKVSYEESWGEVLGRQVHPRCKICPDGIGLMADLVFGDAWETKDGYPDFKERDGISLAIVRTQQGNDLIKAASAEGYISIDELQKDKVEKMQPYQYERRLFVGYRLIIIQLFTLSLLNFKNTAFLKLMGKYPVLKGIKNSVGTMRRFIFS